MFSSKGSQITVTNRRQNTLLLVGCVLPAHVINEFHYPVFALSSCKHAISNNLFEVDDHEHWHHMSEELNIIRLSSVVKFPLSKSIFSEISMIPGS